MTTIDYLNDDCLIEIFSYLDIRERQRLELVCKRWREIIPIIWRTMRKFEYILIGPHIPSNLITIRDGLKIESKNLSHFGVILKKFNGNLEKLGIISNIRSAEPLEIPSWIFKLIIENEKLNSLEIDLNNKPIYKECVKFLKTDNLHHLKLSRPYTCEHSTSVLDVIKDLLLKAPRLETLHLLNVPISIQKINKITTLKLLHIVSGGRSMALLVKKFNFINLESIHLLQCPCVRDTFIKQLVKDCPKLRNVEIQRCDMVTERGLIPITTLRGLRYFSATRMNNEVFDNLSQLESIACGFLTLEPNTMHTSISNFFTRSPNLKKAIVSVNGDDSLFHDYARQSNININQDWEFYRSCFCKINWQKQFDN